MKKTTAQGIVNYFYDGSSEVAETDGAGNVLNTFDPGISVTDQQGTKLFYLYNGHGDVAGLMDDKLRKGRRKIMFGMNGTESYSFREWLTAFFWNSIFCIG